MMKALAVPKTLEILTQLFDPEDFSVQDMDVHLPFVCCPVNTDILQGTNLHLKQDGNLENIYDYR
jgi:hypothetical protein